MLVEARELGDGVRLLTMNRPPANAISAEFNASLLEQCREARGDKAVRAVIVTGAGKFFSGGIDIRDSSDAPERLAGLAGSEDDGLYALWTMPKPTIAMINGHAIAGGLVIALACDFRLTSSGGHRIGFNELAIGLPFPRGAFEIARLTLSRRSLRHALLRAELVGPEPALKIGYIDEVTEPAGLEARCVELARRLGHLGQLAYSHTKRAIQRQALSRIHTESREARGELVEIAKSEETRALLKAHLGGISKR